MTAAYVAWCVLTEFLGSRFGNCPSLGAKSKYTEMLYYLSEIQINPSFQYFDIIPVNSICLGVLLLLAQLLLETSQHLPLKCFLVL